MQVTIARQLGLDPSTVSNFFMNARRRSVDKWKDDNNHLGGSSNSMSSNLSNLGDYEEASPSPPPPPQQQQQQQDDFYQQQQLPQHQQQQQPQQHQLVQIPQAQTVTLALGQMKTASGGTTVLIANGSGPAAVVQHLQHPHHGGDLTPTSLGSAASLDL